MGTIAAPPTSKSLLGALGKPDRPQECKAAWDKFVNLYGPIVILWGRKYRVPEDRLPELPGTLLLKLHEKMRFWEFRRWFKTLAGSVGKKVLEEIKATAPGSAPANDQPPPNQNLWLRFLTTLKPEVLDSLALHQTILAETGHVEWSQTWKSFTLAIGPSLNAWLQTFSISESRRQALIADFLGQMEQAIPLTPEANLPRFHSWLHMVVRNAAWDMLKEWQPPGEFVEELTSVAAREDLIDELERREVREEAERRVRNQVSDRDWSVYQQIVHERTSSQEVAERFGINLDNLWKISGRVKEKMRREITTLSGESGDHGED